MPHKIFILCIALALMSSCSSDRYISSRPKPEIIETGYNLVRAKLNKLGLLEKYVVEMDTASCSHAVWKDYHNSWLAELFDIGEEKQEIRFGYVLSVVGKSYWKSIQHFSMDNPRQIFYTKAQFDEMDFNVSRKMLCLGTVPDTGLYTIPISFTRMLDSGTIAKVEEVIEVARQTFQIDTQFRCIRAMPRSNDKYNSNTHQFTSSEFWSVAFEIQPSDTIVYYEMKRNTTKSDEEIKRYLRLRRKTDGWCFCPEFVLSAWVDITDKRVFLAYLDYRILDDLILSPGPEHLSAIEAMFDERIRKWREANADYIKSKQ